MPTKNLIQGHNNYLSDFISNKKFFIDLAEKGQHPKVCWIGCSDSRVIPEFIMGAQPGDMFVLRNIANIIPPQAAKDNCISSALEYAVFELKVIHIVICGHTECGGIKALLQDSQALINSPVSPWLKHALPAKERILSNCVEKEMQKLETIKENILLQKEHLLTYRFINEKCDSGELEIYTWLYDLFSGTLSSYKKTDKSWINLTTPD
jgi:carbonic anhydrase